MKKLFVRHSGSGAGALAAGLLMLAQDNGLNVGPKTMAVLPIGLMWLVQRVSRYFGGDDD